MTFRPKTGWTSLVLIACLMLTVAWSIALAQPGPAVGALSLVVLGGVLAGTVMGALTWLPAGLAHLASMGVGTLWTAVLIGERLEDFPSAPAADLAQLGIWERTSLVGQWYRAYVASHPFPARALEGLTLAPADANDLMYFFFLVTMAMLMWLLAYICTWFVVRYLSWWGAVLPSGFALVFNLTNSPQHDSHVWYLGFFLFCAFLLAAQVFAALQVDHWRERHVGFSLDLQYELLRDAVILAVVCLALGALLPQDMGMDPVQQTLRDLARNPRRAMSQQIRSWFPGLVGAGRGEGNSFGDTMDLGGSISLTSAPVFEVELSGTSRPPGYFRQAVYDRYDGRRWQRGSDERRDLPADEDWGTAARLTVPVTQTIRTLMPQTLQLYAAPQPSRFSLNTRAETADDEPLTIESRKTLPLGSIYTVVSSLTAADPASLREIDADPAEIVARHTQLPEELPERVRALARQWVEDAGATTRFDMASALESRLREHIRYSEQIDQPPAGRDRVDWVLFDGRQGYCDYYASSFVVMARSLGIPARLATGYALGERKGEGRYLMAASNAHAWPEVYFPDYGWVEFEPTGGGGHGPIARPDEPGRLAGDGLTPEQERPAREVERPAEDAANGTEDPAGATPDAEASGAGGAAAGRAIPWRLLGGLAGLVLVAWLTAWAVWLRPFRGLSPAEGAFARLSRVTDWMGIGRRRSDTPYEFEARLQRSFPQARPEFSTIIDRFVRERFGRRAAAEASALTAAWQAARTALIRGAGPITWRRLRNKGRPSPAADDKG